MKPKRVFVTGAAGFLGREVVRELLARDVEVTCLVRLPEVAARLVDTLAAMNHATSGRLDLVYGSLRDESVPPAWLTDCDVVVHAAGAMRGSASVLVRQNVAATRALTHVAAASGIHRFVLVSSLSVYETERLVPDSVLDERCAIEPAPERRGGYVYSKVVQESVCRDTCGVHRLPLVVIRPGVIFGPGRSALSDRIGPRMGRLVAMVDSNRRLPYTFVANCASAIADAVLANGIEGEAFNVVDDELPTARQIVHLENQRGANLRVLSIPGWAAGVSSRMYGWWYARADGQLPPGFLPQVAQALYKPLQFSNARARSRLGWRPRVDLSTALRLTQA
jgi:nucleoside-diphosphate-sugar epimerase